MNFRQKNGIRKTVFLPYEIKSLTKEFIFLVLQELGFKPQDFIISMRGDHPVIIFPKLELDARQEKEVYKVFEKIVYHQLYSHINGLKKGFRQALELDAGLNGVWKPGLAKNGFQIGKERE